MTVLFSMLIGLACTDYTVTEGKPDLSLSTQTVDFGEVVLGRQTTIGIEASNGGIGDLVFDEVVLDDDSSADFTVLSLAETTLGTGESVEIQTRYTPDIIGQDFGTIMVSSNDPDEPFLEVSLEAFGTEPLIDVDPETLYFGILEVGESSTLDFVVSASGTGDLIVQSMEFESDEGDAYTLDLPESVDLPYTMSAGLSFSVDVTFAPPDDAEWSGELLVASNDPTTPEVSIALIGNSEDDPTDNADPVVEITDPDAGDYFLQGDSVTVNAVVYDEEDDPESLIVVFYADSTTLGSATPEADGSVTLETEELVPGEVDLVVRAMDSDGQTGEDSVTVKVFDPLEPLEYTISGGDTLFDYWNVDDDVVIMLDGTAIFSDTNDTQDNHPPIEFEAEKGATIRIVATDVNACEQRIDALTLHFGAGYSQELNEEHCASTCSSDACYDSSLSISYPDDFLDEEYVITIP